MEIEVKIDAQYKTPKAVIFTAEITDEVNALLQKLSAAASGNIVGFQKDVATILQPDEIIRVYAENQKVFCETTADVYLLRLRLYEAESVLDSRHFVRISNSEIVNFRKVKNLDLSFTGTICLKLQDGQTLFVSRRYVPKIKTILGL